ncbi:MAG: hypothetical protein AB1942_12805 [Pseudomonadota bacterium]
MRKPSLLDNLRDRAQRAVASNAQALSRLTDLRSTQTAEQRARRFWDVPGKIAYAEQVMEEERLRSIDEARAAGLPDAHNNAYDARRHARATKRIAEVAGPAFAELAGIGHEAHNMLDSMRVHGVAGPYQAGERMPTPGETWDESRMDLESNRVGLDAAINGTPIDESRLPTHPVQSKLGPLYRHPPAGLQGFGRR